jgi:hypothetical protein
MDLSVQDTMNKVLKIDHFAAGCAVFMRELHTAGNQFLNTLHISHIKSCGAGLL